MYDELYTRLSFLTPTGEISGRQHDKELHSDPLVLSREYSAKRSAVPLRKDISRRIYRDNSRRVYHNDHRRWRSGVALASSLRWKDVVFLMGVRISGVGFSFSQLVSAKENPHSKDIHIIKSGAAVTVFHVSNLLLNGRVDVISSPKNPKKDLIVYGFSQKAVKSRASEIQKVHPFDRFTRQGIQLTPVCKSSWSVMRSNPDNVFVNTSGQDHQDRLSLETVHESPMWPSELEFKRSFPEETVTPMELPRMENSHRFGNNKNLGKTIFWSNYLEAGSERESREGQETIEMVHQSEALTDESLSNRLRPGLHPSVNGLSGEFGDGEGVVESAYFDESWHGIVRRSDHASSFRYSSGISSVMDQADSVENPPLSNEDVGYW